MVNNRLLPALRLFFVSSLFIGLLISCDQQKSGNTSTTAENDEELRKKANDLAHKYIITDGHIDLPYRLRNKMEDVSKRTESGEFDYVRAKEGGLDAPFMSIYVAASYQTSGGAKAVADTLIDMVVKLTTDHPDKFALANSPAEVQQNFEQGKISLPMGMENGAPIEEKLENVAYFHQRGIRYITLAHGKDNFICDSSYDTTRTWNGLSPMGKQVVAEMNRVGIMVDVSHISDSAFYQVMRHSQAPAIASHSSCRHFTPGFERNMTDDMIKLLASKGGVIQITFVSTFLDSTSRKQADLNNKHVADWLKENNLSADDPKAEAYEQEYMKKHTKLSDVSVVADHIDHVVKLVGVDHVGLGSDFDGAGPTLPKGLSDVSFYPNLIYHLLKKGYSEDDIRKICSANVFRVWNEVERVANASQQKS
jgi:membrane dipeptidase